MDQSFRLDPGIRDWVLLPVMIAMLVVGILRHFATILMHSNPKLDLKQIRENCSLVRARILRTHASSILTEKSFNCRRSFLVNAFEEGIYLKHSKDDTTNPLTDPSSMQPMMDMMIKNMMMFIPQTIMMSWISFFFSGFVLIRLPFPLPLRFKSMLQRGIETQDMDVTWVSSLSWYFLNLFGLSSIFTLILGDSSGAGGIQDMNAMGAMNPGAGMQQPAETAKMFESEKEFLELQSHVSALDDVETRVLARWLLSEQQELSA